MKEGKDTPRSSTASADISARGIVGQEDDALRSTINNDYQQGSNVEGTNTPHIRGNNKSIKMILLTQCLAG